MKISFSFDALTKITLESENPKETQLLDMAFNGNEVKRIQNASGAAILTLSTSGIKEVIIPETGNKALEVSKE